jgi:hypothetical protein
MSGYSGSQRHGRPIKRRTKQRKNTPQVPKKSVKDGYSWLFGDTAPTDAEQAEREEKHQADAMRRQDGYEWLFG